jgi:hypothetical protein
MRGADAAGGAIVLRAHELGVLAQPPIRAERRRARGTAHRYFL